MTDSLREEWKQTGKGLGKAFKDLSKSLINSAKYGVEKAAQWAEEGAQQNDDGVIDAEPVEETQNG